ncbi:Outer membrane protein assembly factor YaeT [hydrothermal vent metagenome]|uniref:Outer membrane protein assembly factor YaeT n=1 Tax=hydrothermal vent metagenome TaxID=652676 RepID=A0A3B1B3I5_9ZZZZ
MKKKFALILLGCLVGKVASAYDAFVIKDIRLEGLQRITVGTVFNYLPVKIGDTLDEKLGAQLIRSLYQSSYFKDVRLEREGDVLVVFVAERSAIANVKYEGNSDITTEQLETSLKQLGLAKGRVLDRSLLDKIEQELKRQYYGLGKYGVKVSADTKQLERNRVDVTINIAEGDPAEIAAITIIGNQKYNSRRLLNQMQLGETSMFGGRNKYSKQLLGADLETLKSYYLDTGYINFKIDSTQVSLTPDKEDVYITVNLTEGEQYKVRSIKFAGDLIIEEKEFWPLVSLKEDDIFSRRKSLDTSERVSNRLAEEGYAFANVNIVPDVDKDTRTVGLTIFVDPGRRVYVRKVNITGNSKSKDRVIRREVRQMEGDWMSTKLVSLSRTRLDRLGFFEQVNVETPSVPGTTDQVDVNLSVSERPTGNLTAGVGYSDSQGAMINMAITQQNFVGTGKQVGLSIDRSSVSSNISLNYTDPYYTQDGISRGFRLYYRKIDTRSITVTNFLTESRGLSVSYGLPLNETDRSLFTLGYDNTKLFVEESTTSQDILDFVEENGNVYDNLNAGTSWSRDRRNRRILPTAGSYSRAGVDMTIPGSDLQYYKLNLRHTRYFAFGELTTLMLKGVVGYGEGYGKTSSLPPFQRYYAGGSNSVRGYDSNSLGPRDSKTNNTIGGDKKLIGNIELILPNPFTEKSGSTRISAFFDIGNVFAADTSFDFNELRQSAGLAFLWLAPVGAMRFSYAIPLNDQEGDRIQNFQFTMGTPF